jgi:hypothetical protein
MLMIYLLNNCSKNFFHDTIVEAYVYLTNWIKIWNVKWNLKDQSINLEIILINFKL